MVWDFLCERGAHMGETCSQIPCYWEAHQAVGLNMPTVADVFWRADDPLHTHVQHSVQVLQSYRRS